MKKKYAARKFKNKLRFDRTCKIPPLSSIVSSPKPPLPLSNLLNPSTFLIDEQLIPLPLPFLFALKKDYPIRIYWLKFSYMITIIRKINDYLN